VRQRVFDRGHVAIGIVRKAGDAAHRVGGRRRPAAIAVGGMRMSAGGVERIGDVAIEIVNAARRVANAIGREDGPAHRVEGVLRDVADRVLHGNELARVVVTVDGGRGDSGTARLGDRADQATAIRIVSGGFDGAGLVGVVGDQARGVESPRLAMAVRRRFARQVAGVIVRQRGGVAQRVGDGGDFAGVGVVTVAGRAEQRSDRRDAATADGEGHFLRPLSPS
jgi:hypothetical protein